MKSVEISLLTLIKQIFHFKKYIFERISLHESGLSESGLFHALVRIGSNFKHLICRSDEESGNP